MAAAMTFAEAIDAIEEAYEFMLAYAAQGRRRDDDDQGMGIRDRLTRVEAALGVIKVLPIVPARSVTLSLFRRRQPLSRRKEAYLAAVRELLKDVDTA